MIKRDTKEEILLTAAQLFFNHGFHIGIDRIIPKSGVAKMTFYKHFRAKTKLISAVIEEAHTQVMKPIHELEKNSKLQGTCLAARAFDATLKSMTEGDYPGGLVTRAVVELLGNEKKPYELARKCEAELFDAIQRVCLNAGVDGLVVARQIHLLIVGGTVLRLIDVEGESFRAVKAGIGDLLARKPGRSTKEA
jgi:AcrR family transcriptional regulator